MRDSKLYAADELAFLRSRLPLYLETRPRSRERASFITVTAELFLQDFDRPCKSTGLPKKLKDLKEVRRYSPFEETSLLIMSIGHTTVVY